MKSPTVWRYTTINITQEGGEFEDLWPGVWRLMAHTVFPPPFPILPEELPFIISIIRWLSVIGEQNSNIPMDYQPFYTRFHFPPFFSGDWGNTLAHSKYNEIYGQCPAVAIQWCRFHHPSKILGVDDRPWLFSIIQALPRRSWLPLFFFTFKGKLIMSVRILWKTENVTW